MFPNTRGIEHEEREQKNKKTGKDTKKIYIYPTPLPHAYKGTEREESKKGTKRRGEGEKKGNYLSNWGSVTEQNKDLTSSLFQNSIQLL